MVKNPKRYGLWRIGTAAAEAILAHRQRLGSILNRKMIPEQCSGCSYIAPMVRRKLAKSRLGGVGPPRDR